MSDEIRPGMRVISKFGSGLVRSTDGRFASVEVQREQGISRLRIPCHELKCLESTSTSVGSDISLLRAAPPIGNSPQLKALHSLRFGLVPHERLPELTYGFSDIEEWVLGCLPEGLNMRPKVAEVFGQYGTGKSHTMAVVRHIAKREGYVVARVEVDSKSISLSEPKTLLSNLWNNLEAHDLHSTTPLLDIYCRAMERGNPAPQFAPQGLDRIYFNYQTLELLKRRDLLEKYEVEYNAVLSCHDEITASDLHREVCRESAIHCLTDNPRVVPMIGHRVLERPYDFVEALFGNGLVCHLAGYKGLVVTVDEFEIEHLGKNRWNRVVALIDALDKYLSKQTNHGWAPVSLFFATLDIEGHIGDAVIDHLVEITDGEYYPLEEFEWESIGEIGLQIKKLYYETYGISDDQEGPDMEEIWEEILLDSGKVRSFIKHYMAQLDAMFGPPNHQ